MSRQERWLPIGSVVRVVGCATPIKRAAADDGEALRVSRAVRHDGRGRRAHDFRAAGFARPHTGVGGKRRAGGWHAGCRGTGEHMAGINLKYNWSLDALVLKPGKRDVVSYRLATRLFTSDVPELLHLWRSVPSRGLARSRSVLPAADLGAFWLSVLA